LQKLLTSVLGNAIISANKTCQGGRIMNKEEILKKAQAEKRDEREVQVKDKSMMWSYIVMVLMATVFSIIRSEQGLPIMDLSATCMASVCASMTYRFIKTKDKSYLLVALISVNVAIIATVRFFMGH
jgi:hypothetical protein